jgi:hypothetical protein
MPRRLRLTVTANKGEGWTVSGGDQAKTYRTKEEAVRQAAAAGRANGYAQVVIKGRNGRIQSERTYGTDPRRTKG